MRGGLLVARPLDWLEVGRVWAVKQVGVASQAGYQPSLRVGEYDTLPPSEFLGFSPISPVISGDEGTIGGRAPPQTPQLPCKRRRPPQTPRPAGKAPRTPLARKRALPLR